MALRSEPRFVYVVGVPGRVKVGMTCNYQKRKLGFNHVMGVRTPALLIEHDAARAIESMAKDDLYPFSCYGFEMFCLPVRTVVAAVRKVVAEYEDGRRPLTACQRKKLKERRPRIQKLRDKGLSLARVAEAMGVSPGTIRNWTFGPSDKRRGRKKRPLR